MDTPHKVLVCASVASHLENFHLPYLEWFQKSGWTVHTASKGILATEFADRQFEIPFEKRMLSYKNVTAMRMLRQLLQRERYDLVCVHTNLAAALCRLAFWGRGCKNTRLVSVSHGYFFQSGRNGAVKRGLKNRAYLWIERALSGRTDLLFTMNRADWESAKRYRLGKQVSFLDGMGLCTGKYPAYGKKQAGQLRRQWGAGGQDKVFLCVGEFSGRKDQMTVLQAFCSLAKREKGARLVFAGTGALEGQCRSYAQEQGLEGRVFFAGQVEEIGAYYSAADILVTASRSEGLPFNLLEGLYYHLPVIASRVKGHMDLIADGENGLLFDAGDPDGLCRCMRQAVSVPGLLGGLRQGAYLESRYAIGQVRGRFFSQLNQAFGFSFAKPGHLEAAGEYSVCPNEFAGCG